MIKTTRDFQCDRESFPLCVLQEGPETAADVVLLDDEEEDAQIGEYVDSAPMPQIRPSWVRKLGVMGSRPDR